MKYGDFHGHKAVVLENEHFRLECLAQAGPRVVRLIPHWTGENLFAEVPNFSKKLLPENFNILVGIVCGMHPSLCPIRISLIVLESHSKRFRTVFD